MVGAAPPLRLSAAEVETTSPGLRLQYGTHCHQCSDVQINRMSECLHIVNYQVKHSLNSTLRHPPPPKSPLTSLSRAQLLTTISPSSSCGAMSASQTQQPSRHGRPLEPNRGQSLRSTPLLQNTQHGQHNQVELFLTLCARPDAEATASGMVASHLVTQNGIISVEPRVGLQQGG